MVLLALELYEVSLTVYVHALNVAAGSLTAAVSIIYYDRLSGMRQAVINSHFN